MYLSVPGSLGLYNLLGTKGCHEEKCIYGSLLLNVKCPIYGVNTLCGKDMMLHHYTAMLCTSVTVDSWGITLFAMNQDVNARKLRLVSHY